MKNKLIIIFFTIIIVSALTLIIIKSNQSTQKVVAQKNIDNQTNTVMDEAVVVTIEETPISSTIPSSKPEVSQKPILSSGKYYIKVNTEMNTVTIYMKDDVGNYTVPVKAMVCSTGEGTPKNCKYVLNGKKWAWKLLYGNVYGQYCTHINMDILFHSVPYLREKDNSSLEYWEYDKLGETASAGCVRLTVEDAKWIYDNCLYGSTLEFYSSAEPGPLGKPTAMKISDNVECRDWDPTDPISTNPWRTETL